MRPDGISVSAIRTTPVSTPLRVRTSVVIAKAMIRRLAAIPSRLQPIRSLKPRPSVVSSPCIRPPGGAATIESPSKGSMASGGQSVHLQRSIRQKRVVVQSLTTPASSFDRRGCHMPYIWRHAQESSLGCRSVRVPSFAMFAVPSRRFRHRQEQPRGRPVSAYQPSNISARRQRHRRRGVFPEGGRLPGDRRHHRGSRNDCASVLQKTLDEERATDKKLTTLAESRI